MLPASPFQRFPDPADWERHNFPDARRTYVARSARYDPPAAAQSGDRVGSILSLGQFCPRTTCTTARPPPGGRVGRPGARGQDLEGSADHVCGLLCLKVAATFCCSRLRRSRRKHWQRFVAERRLRGRWQKPHTSPYVPQNGTPFASYWVDKVQPELYVNSMAVTSFFCSSSAGDARSAEVSHPSWKGSQAVARLVHIDERKPASGCASGRTDRALRWCRSRCRTCWPFSTTGWPACSNR